jgi:hypothetical protein
MKPSGSLASLVLLSACSPPKSLAEQYRGPWREPTGEVAIALGQNGAKGCGEFYQKPAVEAQSEYAVACTRDGIRWEGYLVWPSIGKILGPDDSLVAKLGKPYPPSHPE